MLDPDFIISFDPLVVHIQVLTQEHLDFNIRCGLDPQSEKPRLLRQQPLSQLVISAIGEAADKVRNGVILAEFLVVDDSGVGVNLRFFVYPAFECKFPLVCVFVDFFGQVFLIFVSIVPILKLNFAAYINSILRNTCSRFSAV